MAETNFLKGHLKQLRKWKFYIAIAILILVVTVSVLITISEHSDEHVFDSGHQTELDLVQLAVNSMMANPDTPIRTLNGSDTRIADFTPCGDDPSHPIALTQDMSDGGLIDICTSAECVAVQGTPHPVSHYMASGTTEYWYCVHDDGEVWSYTENCISQEGIDCEKVRIVPPK